jgi:cyclic-di-GMP phosphodiesterase TipF (flagellum assembly factor)
MLRVTAIFIALCMALIAGSLGFVAYLRFGLTGAESALVALGTLIALAVYNAIVTRKRDRIEATSQLANLARGAEELARQIGEFGRRLGALEVKVDSVIDRTLATAKPLATEIEELSTLVKQLADSVTAHDVALAAGRHREPEPAPAPPAVAAAAAETVAATAPVVAAAASAVTPPAPSMPDRNVPAFAGLDDDGIIAAIKAAIEGGKVDLYLQPVVTLPQRKVRYYEALSRMKAENGDLVAAVDFLRYAEAGGLTPKLDNLTVQRCVQVVRRLLLKNREVGLFCNLSTATLSDSGFPKLLELLDANRAIASSLTFEFGQSAVRAMGLLEYESLAALAALGFRFSMDNLTDLRVDARELNERGFRFVKAPAALLFNRVGAVSSDIHPADFSDLLGRFGIDLVAERIENETTVVDLLDYDVRFGQGLLFSPPRPLRAEALQAVGPVGGTDNAKAPDAPSVPPAANDTAPASGGGLAQLARAVLRGGR